MANGVFIGAINRPGTEAPWNIGRFYGSSYVCDPRGQILAEASEDRDELVTGPTIGWKPTRQLRISLAPLFGCTGDSPRVESFVLVSYEFGGAEAVVAAISGNH